MRDDKIDVESYQFRNESGKTRGFACSPPVLDAEVLTFNVAAIAQSLAECVGRGSVLGGSHRAEDPDARSLRRLSRRCERRGKRTSQRGQQEAAAVHAGTVGHATTSAQARTRTGARCAYGLTPDAPSPTPARIRRERGLTTHRSTSLLCGKPQFYCWTNPCFSAAVAQSGVSERRHNIAPRTWYGRPTVSQCTTSPLIGWTKTFAVSSPGPGSGTLGTQPVVRAAARAIKVEHIRPRKVPADGTTVLSTAAPPTPLRRSAPRVQRPSFN